MTPVELDVYRGNPNHKTNLQLQNNRIDVKVLSTVEPPKTLDAVARKEWRRVVPLLKKYNILSDIDVNTLTLYCQSWSDWIRYTLLLRKEGETYNTPSGQCKPRPEIMMRRNAFLEVVRTAIEFGGTPSSRTGMQVSLNQVRRSIKETMDDLDNE